MNTTCTASPPLYKVYRDSHLWTKINVNPTAINFIQERKIQTGRIHHCYKQVNNLKLSYYIAMIFVVIWMNTVQNT